MVGFASTARRAGFGIAAAAFVGIAPAFAADFAQDDCKVVAGTASEVVRTVGAKTLSREFRQSFMNWMGRGISCDGPKDIIIMSENDSVTYRTIRSMLLAGSHPLSLQKAGLRVVVRTSDKVSAVAPTAQVRGEAAHQAALN